MKWKILVVNSSASRSAEALQPTQSQPLSSRSAECGDGGGQHAATAASLECYEQLRNATVERTLAECRWLVDSAKSQAAVFDSHACTRLVRSLVEEATLIVAFTLRAVNGMRSAELALELMRVYYDFMAYIVQSVYK